VCFARKSENIFAISYKIIPPFNRANFANKCTQILQIVYPYIVKDDIELGYLNTIPLWQFGLTY
jgi:hypothetical protein